MLYSISAPLTSVENLATVHNQQQPCTKHTQHGACKDSLDEALVYNASSTNGISRLASLQYYKTMMNTTFPSCDHGWETNSGRFDSGSSMHDMPPAVRGGRQNAISSRGGIPRQVGISKPSSNYRSETRRESYQLGECNKV